MLAGTSKCPWLFFPAEWNTKEHANTPELRGIQSAGAAVMWRIDGLNAPYMNEFASCWALLAGSLLCALPLILFRVKDESDAQRDIAFSDQTYAEVAPDVEGKTVDGYGDVTLQTIKAGDEKV